MKSCTHLQQVKVKETTETECAECLLLGDTWVQLRMCTTCGNVGCCDSSKNKHATRHFQETNHPVMKAVGTDGDWMWCYVDENYIGDE